MKKLNKQQMFSRMTSVVEGQKIEEVAQAVMSLTLAFASSKKPNHINDFVRNVLAEALSRVPVPVVIPQPMVEVVEIKTEV